jgi:transcriptional regulator with XRE-family HTH domain
MGSEEGMETIFGTQPLRLVLFQQDITGTKVATDLDISYGHLRRVITGRCRPMDDVREKLPAYLGVPLEELFTPEVLAKPYVVGRGVKR